MRERLVGPDGHLRAQWFAVLLVAYGALSLGLASIGGWPGIAAVVALQVVVIGGIIASADGRRAHEGAEADDPVTET